MANKKNIKIELDASQFIIYGFSQQIPTQSEVLDLLEQATTFKVIRSQNSADPETVWQFATVLKIGRKHYEYDIFLSTAEEDLDVDWELLRNVDANLVTLQTATGEDLEPRWALMIETVFSGPITGLKDWQQQLKVVLALLQDDEVVVDGSSDLIFSHKKLAFLSQLKAPPGVRNLYKQSILANFFEDSGEYRLWPNTLGLRRFCGIELELLGLNFFDEVLSVILDVSAAAMLCGAYQVNQHEVSIGLDFKLSLIPWQEALRYFPSNTMGGLLERQDSRYRQASCVLYYKRGRTMGFVGPEFFIDQIKADQIFLVYPSEIQENMRINALALWSQVCKFRSIFGGVIYIHVLNSEDRLVWYIFQKQRRNGLILATSQDQWEFFDEFPKERIYNWSLKVGDDLYEVEDFFILQESLANSLAKRKNNA